MWHKSSYVPKSVIFAKTYVPKNVILLIFYTFADIMYTRNGESYET
jgi:hypothetical protein